MELIGVDGCKAGWLVVTGDTTRGPLRFSVKSGEELAEVVGRAEGGRARIVIDIPIGLPDGPQDDGTRACDRAARAYLGKPRSNSVFPAPCRATLDAADADYQAACEANRLACGKRITKQLFGILRKIRDVDGVITPTHQEWVREAHPEVTFAALAGEGRGLTSHKRASEGRDERLGLLAPFFPNFDPEEVRSHLLAANGLPAAHVAPDDIVDAVVCLITAHRIVTQEARVFPSGVVPRDARGLRMEIVA
jgi:predicted RNase H-like nuclease